MKRMLWKEFAERKLWLPVLAISVAGVVPFGHPYTFWQGWRGIDNWILPSVVLALFLGMTAYSGELASGTPDFLSSKPVSWKRVLLSKAIVGLGMVAASALAGALVFRLSAPAPYARFLTMEQFLQGLGLATMLMGSAWAMGAVCSVLLPGFVGSVLTAVSMAAVAGGLLPLVDRVSQGNSDALNWFMAAWAAAVVVAGVVVIRFGLTLPLAQRVKRFTAVALPLIFVGGVIAVQAPVPAEPPIRYWSISPDGAYALALLPSVPDVMVRLKDGKQDNLPRITTGMRVYWSANSAALLQFQSGLLMARMTPSGSVRARHIMLGGDTPDGTIAPSPDRKLLAVPVHYAGWNSTPERVELQVVDALEGMRLLSLPIGLHSITFWWSSNDRITYRDAHGEWSTVDVRQEASGGTLRHPRQQDQGAPR